MGDALRAALRPFGLSRVSPSQAKPAAAIARRPMNNPVSQAIDHLINRNPERDEWLLRSAEQIRQWRAEDLFSREARAAEKAAGNNNGY
jgi:hypothetical protein